MRKTHIVGLALFAVLAFGAITAASAFAALPEWLVGGKTFEGTLSSVTEGLLELIKYTGPGGGVVLNTFDCEGFFDGSITQTAAGPGTDEIDEVLNAAREVVQLATLALSCTVTQRKEAADCKLNTLVEVWPINLPWSTELELMTTSVLDKFLAPVGKVPGYEIKCETEILGIHIEEECTGATSAVVTNAATMPPSVLGEFNAESERSNCSGTGANSGALLGGGHTWALEGAVKLGTAVND